MEKEKLKEILDKHEKWLNGEEGGKPADLCYAHLRGANFRSANLCGVDFRDADLRDSDLRSCNLRNADLRGADLQGANLDFSCLPLWCGSLTAQLDDRQLIQIAYHLVKAGLQSKNASKETKQELSKLIGFANKFHRVDECGKIERIFQNDEF